MKKSLSSLFSLTGLLLWQSTLAAHTAPESIPTDAREVNPVEVGATAPDVPLTRSDGTEVMLHSLTQNEPIALVFYRGGWCPYCNTQLSSLGAVESDLRELGFDVHAVSVDRWEKVADARESADFAYALYSDASARAAKAFGLAFRVDGDTYQRLLGYGINLEEASGETHHILPVPAVFLIDQSGRIRFRYFNADYKERLSGEALVKAARNGRPSLQPAP